MTALEAQARAMRILGEAQSDLAEFAKDRTIGSLLAAFAQAQLFAADRLDAEILASQAADTPNAQVFEPDEIERLCAQIAALGGVYRPNLAECGPYSAKAGENGTRVAGDAENSVPGACDGPDNAEQINLELATMLTHAAGGKITVSDDTLAMLPNLTLDRYKIYGVDGGMSRFVYEIRTRDLPSASAESGCPQVMTIINQRRGNEHA